MITLGAYVPTPNDGTSWYRSFGALRYCRKDVDVIALNAESDNTWFALARCDVIYVQRPAVNSSVYHTIFKYAELLNVPLWVDFDDYLWEAPSYNPVAHMFNTEESRSVVRTALQQAAAVTVTTQALADAFDPLAKLKPIVIPNAWDPNLQIIKSEGNNGDPLRIMWRGGHSHGFDLQIGCEFFLNPPENSKMIFLGHCPEFTFFSPESTTVIQEHMPCPKFLYTMSTLRPDFVVVPLVDNQFNHCKSDIAYLEATMCGALCIAPAWEPWLSDKNCLCYDPEKPFREQADKFIADWRDPVKRAAAVKEAQQYVREERTTDGQVAAARLNIINRLAGRSS
jgi:hypothetical protein